MLQDSTLLRHALLTAKDKRFENGLSHYFDIIEKLFIKGVSPNATFTKSVLLPENIPENDEPLILTDVQVPVVDEILWSCFPPNYLALFIKYGLNVDTVLDPYHYTPLHQCIHLIQLDKAKLLLQHGANPNIPNVNQDTPLMTAIENDWNNKYERVEMLRLLITHKDTDLRLTNKEGKTARDIAVEKNDHAIVNFIDGTIDQKQGGTRYPVRLRQAPDRYEPIHSVRESRLHRVIR